MSDSKLIRIQWNPSHVVLRQFSWITLGIAILIAMQWTQSLNIRWALITIGIVIAVVGTWKPYLIKPLFVGLTMFTAPIGMLVGELALIFIYFGQLLPFGIVFRLIGRDPLRLTIERDRKSYWSSTSNQRTAKDYFRQF